MVVYLSHTLGGDRGGGRGEADAYMERGNHSANAYDWLRFLVNETSWALLMPWYTYVVALGELMRPRGFVDQLRILKRCDALVLVGGEVSPHMREEIRVAQVHNVAVIDLTDLGYYPPRNTRIADLLEERTREAFDKIENRLLARTPLVGRTPTPPGK